MAFNGVFNVIKKFVVSSNSTCQPQKLGLSNDENKNIGKPFCIERAKQKRALCKKCKKNYEHNELRIAKHVPNPFGKGLMREWYHVHCIFDQFLTQQVSTKRIENSHDIDGWQNLDEHDKQHIIEKIAETEKCVAARIDPKCLLKKTKEVVNNSVSEDLKPRDKQEDEDVKDNLFKEFRRLVADVTNESNYGEKTEIIKRMFEEGSNRTGFKGNLIQWCRLLLPGVIKRFYKLQNKQLIKLFSGIFRTNQEEMMQHLAQGDIGETIYHFFENSNKVKPCKNSTLTLQEVDDFLNELSNHTKANERTFLFENLIKVCTGNDLKIIIRLIKNDLRMNAGAKQVLNAVHYDAYKYFQSSHDLPSVFEKILGKKSTIEIMSPIEPMLAEACKSVEQAMKKCPNGMYSEIKYDGERVQVHKHDSEFKYFSRSLKPVAPYKVKQFKEYIPQAFPYAKDLILDSEILFIDTTNGKPLPFSSLQVRKREKFNSANVCLFVFDCVYYNGESLVHKPIKERRKILKENMIEIPNRIMISEMEEIYRPKDLVEMIVNVLNLGFEGLVLKDIMSFYEPGMRHWLKIKKDYLLGKTMADSADLIVLGAWYGKGKKRGMMSVFLMGCYDKHMKHFCTVSKVQTGHDDRTLERLQNELDMVKINCEVSKVPHWLKCTKTMIPEFVARDPRKQPVWEITGTKFTQHEVHSANGISIRSPKITKIRNDKTWKTATSLEELKTLHKNSKLNIDYSSLLRTKDINIDVSKQTLMESPDCCDLPKESTTTEKQTPNNKRKHDKNDEMDSKKLKITDVDLSEMNQMHIEEECDIKSPKKIKRDMDVVATFQYSELFPNVKLYPFNEIGNEHEDMLRYFVACGGVIVNHDQRNEATHVVHHKNIVSEEEVRNNFSPYARHVTIDWIGDSIGNNKIQDTKLYAVTWS